MAVVEPRPITELDEEAGTAGDAAQSWTERQPDPEHPPDRGAPEQTPGTVELGSQRPIDVGGPGPVHGSEGPLGDQREGESVMMTHHDVDPCARPGGRDEVGLDPGRRRRVLGREHDHVPVRPVRDDAEESGRAPDRHSGDPAETGRSDD